MDSQEHSEYIPNSRNEEIVDSASSFSQNKRKPLYNKKSNKWKQWEHHQYISFIKNNLKTFKSQALRKKKKVFGLMSKKIPTRTPQQCRSHHQKMVLKYRDQQTIASLYQKQRQGKKKRSQPNQKLLIEYEQLSEQSLNQLQTMMKVENDSQEEQVLNVFDQLDNNLSYIELKQNLRNKKGTLKQEKLRMITQNIEETSTSNLFESLLH